MKKLVFILLSVIGTAGFVILSSACEPYVPPDPPDTLKIYDVYIAPNAWPDWLEPQQIADVQIGFKVDTGKIPYVIAELVEYDSVKTLNIVDTAIFSDFKLVSLDYPPYAVWCVCFPNTVDSIFWDGYFFGRIYDTTRTILLATTDTAWYSRKRHPDKP